MTDEPNRNEPSAEEAAEQAEPAEEQAEIPPLVTMGDPRLARPSAPVPLVQVGTDAFMERLQLLHRAMVHYVGIGIAAPQIGWFERFFIMVVAVPQPDGSERQELQVWVNPEVVEVSGAHNWAWEGCLSVPGLRGWIRRPAEVTVRGHDHTGERIEERYRGWNARVFQHEFDHIEGFVYPYRAQDPRHVVLMDELTRRDGWPHDWPAPGARDAPLGEVVPE